MIVGQKDVNHLSILFHNCCIRAKGRYAITMEEYNPIGEGLTEGGCTVEEKAWEPGLVHPSV